jgi:hypothetical protein
MKIKINHPMADTISIIPESVANLSEVAFFHEREWVMANILNEPPENHWSAEDTAVTRWVSDERLNAFLNAYKAE